eukprot:GHRQ01011091.1.p2 GENE.GHRQ01011091.1~~GHRQ01011091.1.p2  ORF type:complete len:227 (+),score=84.66 GHRQ01011091.1:3-683(+)
MLLPVLQDPRPMVRIITCWCISRYVQWVLLPPGSAEPAPGVPLPRVAPANEALFEQILAGLLSRVADGNGRVQEAACSGLAELMEHAGTCTRGAVLVPRMQPIAETLSLAASSCGRRNLRIVLEAISTTCSVVGGRVLSQHPAAVQQLVVPLLNRWQGIGFLERDVVPIMEALNNMAMGLGPAFEPYAQAVFEKGVMLLQLQQEARVAQVSTCCSKLKPYGANPMW